MADRIPPTRDEDSRAVTAYQPVHSIDIRMFIGVALAVPVLVAAGVYWLHHTPTEPIHQPGGLVIDVRLMENPTPSDASAASLLQPEDSAELATLSIKETAETEPDPSDDPAQEPVAGARLEPVPATAEEMPLPPSGHATHTAAIAAPKSVPNDIASAFQRELVHHITRHRRQLDMAGVKPRGAAKIKFAMRRDGTVTRIWVASSSGHFLLDEAAADTIRRAQPLPKIPAELPDSMIILVPLAF